ncbi:MAG: hypothetical protein PHD72_01575 [Patescibacteria group bacterium]|nr:hypothetical protein [Patescibacteria group bacterium]
MAPKKDFDHRDVPIDLVIREKMEKERKKQNQEGERATIPTYDDPYGPPEKNQTPESDSDTSSAVRKWQI